jgi:hypothetical protein
MSGTTYPLRRCIAFSIFLLLLTAPAITTARTIYVDDDNPADFNNIQAAINDSNDGDVITVGEGTYRENINFNGKNIVLTSTDPNDTLLVENTIIQSNGTTSVVTFSGSEQVDCELRGFTITGGYNRKAGGGIKGNFTRATISHCIICGNRSHDSAGGIDRCDGLISNCTIMNNISDQVGGIAGCKATIRYCNISNNQARTCGGLDGCSGPISNCTISNNKGDGLSVCYGEISNCVISGNTDTGLISCRGPIRNCVITGNNRVGVLGCKSINSCVIVGNIGDEGGGLANCDFISNCIIAGNSAKQGGGIYCINYSTTITNCTITNNSANNGSGIYCLGSDVIIDNCIMTANWIMEMVLIEGFTLNSQGYIQYFPSTATVSYSDVAGGQQYIYVDVNSTLIWGDGNIDADPCFINPGYWDPNGTPWNEDDDFWVNGDYHLKSQAGRWDADEGRWTKDDVTSLCIDAGDPASPIGLEPFPNGGIINMGAYGGTEEASKSYFGEPVCETVVAGDINGDCKVNLLDFAFMAFHWLEKQE